MDNFWQKLKRPFFVQAPMADGTDFVYRQIIAKYGRPDVMYTEFVSADGLAHPEARQKLLWDLEYNDGERPIVAQIFSGRPETIEKSAALIRELGFDGIDINMGCPDRSVEKQGAGASLIKDFDRAVEVIRAAKRGAGDVPVSIKTRIGYKKVITREWASLLLAEDIAALTLHLRTREEMSKVPARWEEISTVTEIENKNNTVIIGNGDITSLKEAEERAREYNIDGVMIGRGLFGNPWFFSGREDITINERLDVMVEHAQLFEEHHRDKKNFLIMRKHVGAYVKGFVGAGQLRESLMKTQTAKEVSAIISEYKSMGK